MACNQIFVTLHEPAAWPSEDSHLPTCGRATSEAQPSTLVAQHHTPAMSASQARLRPDGPRLVDIQAPIHVGAKSCPPVNVGTLPPLLPPPPSQPWTDWAILALPSLAPDALPTFQQS